jgi:tetratricopeptide (TPR) repeat protein
MKKVLGITLLVCIIFSCGRKNKELKKELDNSVENAENILDLTKKTNEEMVNYSDEKLVELAMDLYDNVGGDPHFKEDSLKLYYALRYIEVAIAKNPNNASAYNSKINVYVALKEYKKAIQSINSLFSIKGESAGGLMFKGMLYEMLQTKDSATIAYKKALQKYNEKINETNNLNDKVNKAVLLCLIEEKEKGLKEINNIIKENPNNNYAVQMKEQIIENFDKTKFFDASLR